MTQASLEPGAESIGERLRRVRKERGLSQRQLAEPGVSYAYISRIEAGSRRPSVTALRKLARKLGVSADYLESGVDVSERERRELKLVEAQLLLKLDGDAAAAEHGLRELVDEANAAGDVTLAARAHVTLGLALLERGDAAAAAGELEPALGDEDPPFAAQPEPYVALARAYAAAGQAQKAVAFLERCLDEISNRIARHPTYARFAVYLGNALADMGEPARARAALAKALDHADEMGDVMMRADLYRSQARLAAAENDHRAALDSLRRAVALLEVTEDTRQLGRGRVVLGAILTGDGQAEAALPHLELAEALLGLQPGVDGLGRLRTEQARAAVELGRADEACALAREALAVIAGRNVPERPVALIALGRAHAARQEIDEARAAYGEALELLREQKRWHELLEAARRWAQILREHGQTEEAAAVLDETMADAVRHGTGPSTGSSSYRRR